MGDVQMDMDARNGGMVVIRIYRDEGNVIER